MGRYREAECCLAGEGKAPEFEAVCRPVDPEERPQPEYRTLTPGEGVRCRLCPEARSQELIPGCW